MPITGAEGPVGCARALKKACECVLFFCSRSHVNGFEQHFCLWLFLFLLLSACACACSCVTVSAGVCVCARHTHKIKRRVYATRELSLGATPRCLALLTDRSLARRNRGLTRLHRVFDHLSRPGHFASASAAMQDIAAPLQEALFGSNGQVRAESGCSSALSSPTLATRVVWSA
eukprot:581147-Rhodomonas_salina.1